MSYYKIMLREKDDHWKAIFSVNESSATGETKSDALHSLADKLEE